MNKNEIIIEDDGTTKYWKLNGLLQRDDGPAIVGNDGYKVWYIKGKRHRTDGPAAIYPSGKLFWFLNGLEYSFNSWFSKLTPEQQYNYLWNLDE
jgi:hypothetical protein